MVRAVTFTLAIAVLGCRADDKTHWVAQIDSLAGQVLTATAAGSKATEARLGQRLGVGARLETGSNGVVLLSLKDGGSLTVESNSIVVIQDVSASGRGGQANTTHLVLQQGRLIGTAPQIEAATLLIGAGQRTVRLKGAAKATVEVPPGAGQSTRVLVVLGRASVEGPSGVETVVAGQELQLTAKVAQPDAGNDAASDAEVSADAQVIEAEPIAYRLRPIRGRVWVKQAGTKRFRRAVLGREIVIESGTQLRLAAGASAVVNSKAGTTTVLHGPARLAVREAPATSSDKRGGLQIESVGQRLTISERGNPGKVGPTYFVEGVRISGHVVHERLEARVMRDRERATVIVSYGEVSLTGNDGRPVRLEAGQQAVISKGAVVGRRNRGPGAITIDHPSAMRVFFSDRSLPVSFEIARPPGSVASLVEVAKSRSFARPQFADIIRRSRLTLDLQRGSVYWRARPVAADGSLGKPVQGSLALMLDTSYRVLKNPRPPENTIEQEFGDTTVYYQNALPRFTFHWDAVAKATSYQLKIFRETNIVQPILTRRVTGTATTFDRGRLKEGAFIWYVAARDGRGALLHTSKSRRLRIRYDNATPDLQIVYPRNGTAVSQPSIEVRGVAIPGSQVYVNGHEAELDDTFRFRYVAQLKSGPNDVQFRVVDKRGGVSLYLRRVIRR